MRVATRRLRAALEVFEPCFPRKRFARHLKRVKALADALGERRDRDVEIEFLAGFAEAARKRSGRRWRPGSHPARGAAQANEELAPFLAAKRLRKLRRRLEQLVAGAQR